MLCVCLVMLLALVCTASAETDPITCSIEVTPAYLAGPGTVNVTITVSNSSDQDLQDPVVLYNPLAQIINDFGSGGSAMLKAGQSQTWTGTHDVSERELEQGYILFFVKYMVYQENGQATPLSQPIRATVTKSDAQTKLSVERTITPESAHEGQEVVVKYVITNAGTVKLTDISITENDKINGKTQNIPALEPGFKAEIPYKVTMGKKDLTSNATITYFSESEKEKQTYTVEEKKIPYVEAQLVATLSSSAKGVAIGNKVTLSLELKNKGSVDYSDIRVTDPVLGDVFTNQQLEAGKTITLEKEITLTETADYQFHVTAIDSTGMEAEADTNAVSVTAMNPEDALNLTLTAVADRTEVYDDPARVRFTISVTNDSQVAASDVTISHGTVELYTFDTIAAGETRTLSRDTVLSMTGKYQFSVTAKDPLENETTFLSNEMQIAVYPPTPAPVTPTPPPEPTPEPTFVPATLLPSDDPSIGTVPRAIQKILLPLLIVAGLLLVALGSLLAVATKKRSDRKKASDAAYDHWERARRRDYITPNPDGNQAKYVEPVLTPDEDMKEIQDTLSHSDAADEWELPHLKYARSAVQDLDGQQEEQYSSFAQGFYDDMSDEGFESVQTNNDEYLSFADPSDDTHDAYGFSDPYQDDQLETMGDDRMSYPNADYGYRDDRLSFDSPAYDAYEPQERELSFDNLEASFAGGAEHHQDELTFNPIRHTGFQDDAASETDAADSFQSVRSRRSRQ